ncbi:hypothetical protein OSTOST_14039, partial [Ostertagia ostertagi]
GLTSKTKAIFISHITSSTALILPVKEICDIAKAKGLITIVDGAHVPGHIPLNLSELKPDIYTGACHKWMLTPKGCSFLYVKRELQHLFDPLVADLDRLYMALKEIIEVTDFIEVAEHA